MGVPRLGVVVYDVLLLVVAFADINKTIVQAILLPVVLPTKHTHCATRMPRDIRYLVAVVGIIWVGNINGRLVGILRFGGEVEVFWQDEMQLRIDVYTVDLDQSEVEHCPAELLAFWIGDDLIGNAVVVVIGIEAELRSFLLRNAERLCKT